AFSETGLYEVLLTVPENFVVAMSGTEIESFPSENGTKTVHYVSGPMRDSLLVAGPDFGILTDTVDDIKVNVFYYPGDEATAQDVLKFSTDTVRIFNETFGDYPFAELDVAETFNYTGIEYPGIVVISERNWERGNSFLEITTAHEVGHQWFYSVIGNNQVDQPWLDESLTSYSEYVYVRAVHGADEGKEYVDNERTSYRNYRDVGVDDAVLGLPVSAYPDIYGLIIYTKGPLFFAELERVLGLDVFTQALQHYYAQNKYRVVTSADMLNAFEESTGQQLDEIFYEWVGEFPGLDPAVIEDSQTNAQ
ncbi:MAG TPA: M1 family aminopeptidase, partial [Aggregatilineaceae bacterium]|nr:M1 family aminopeptidase [Aggregatilineaceae bacterium]